MDRSNVAGLAEFARARWKVESNTFKALKDGYHPKHNFGHRKATLASLLAKFNAIAFPLQNENDLACDIRKKARSKLGARYRMLDYLKFLVRDVVLRDWGTVMKTTIAGELPARPP